MSVSKKAPSCVLPFAVAIVFFASLFFTTATMAASTKVAFIGDQGVNENAQAVLSLISNEGADLLLIQGDLGYGTDNAYTWESNLDNFLGKDFPVLTVVGNHENNEWSRYLKLIQQRIDRVDSLNCSGNTAVKAKCSYGNIEVVQVSPGIYEVAGVDAEDDYSSFIQSSFSPKSDKWRICSWHKPHYLFQTGRKTGPSDWSIYDACLDAGAMVALAHEHAYSRTYLLDDFESQSVVHKSSEMSLQPGQSFAVVSGLGGREIREQKRGGDYFASIYTATQKAQPGALFCEFADRTADCYFKAINGAVPDQFTLTRGGESPLEPPATVNEDGYVFSRSDKNEYRWIARNRNGEIGSVWIDKSCATSLGGATVFGDWGELMSYAPAFDSIDNPCVQDGRNDPVVIDAGFVFSRTDKDEYRWIARNSSGILGSTWIAKACVETLGGVKESGDWGDLMKRAPGFDTISNPCD